MHNRDFRFVCFHFFKRLPSFCVQAVAEGGVTLKAIFVGIWGLTMPLHGVNVTQEGSLLQQGAVLVGQKVPIHTGPQQHLDHTVLPALAGKTVCRLTPRGRGLDKGQDEKLGTKHRGSDEVRHVDSVPPKFRYQHFMSTCDKTDQV